MQVKQIYIHDLSYIISDKQFLNQQKNCAKKLAQFFTIILFGFALKFR